MEIAYDEEALDDLKFWKASGNKSVQKKISSLLENISQTPFSGEGKPELLKWGLSGKWSRRINGEHRIVYSVTETHVQVHSLRGHY